MKITIAYFTGTGSTKKVAQTMFEEFKSQNTNCIMFDIAKKSALSIDPCDLLIILSPVHAFRLVVFTENWIKSLPPTLNSDKVAIISVSAGGESSPNTACRTKSKKLLSKKGYRIIYEDMFLMPSNFGTASTPKEIKEMSSTLPIQSKNIVKDILSENTKILKPKFQDKIISSLGKAEHYGARIFGKMLKSNDSCNSCGICTENCPVNNINLKGNKLDFGFNCIWCMKCIYSCPQRAIYPGFLKSVVLKDGFVDYTKWGTK